MKKTALFILSVSFMSATLLTSCNKKLKEDIKELDSEVSDLKTKNETLQNQANGIASILGSNEPITATTSFLDDNGNTKTWTDTYSFKSSNYETQYMEENNGYYEIYIERFGDVNWNEGAWVAFDYMPSSGTITNKRGGQYWEWQLPYSDDAYYGEGNVGCTVNITINSINTTTGDISLTFTATGDDYYASNTSYLPNDDKGATTTFSFTGKLKVFPLN